MNLHEARDILVEAAASLGLSLTPETTLWLLGMVKGENNFGTTPDWTIPNRWNTPETNPEASSGPSFNWGSVRTYKEGQPYIWHPDKGVGPGPQGTHKFARFSSAKEGARYYLQSGVLSLGPRRAVDAVDQIRKALSGNGTLYDFAEGLYEKGYYEGYSGSREDRIRAYANMIREGADHARKALNLPPSLLTSEKKTFPWTLALTLLGVGAVGTLLLARKRPDLLPRPARKVAVGALAAIPFLPP